MPDRQRVGYLRLQIQINPQKRLLEPSQALLTRENLHVSPKVAIFALRNNCNRYLMKFFKSLICLLAVSCAASASAVLPSVRLKDLKGRTVNSATLNNGDKPMILSFFFVGCKPCKRELDAINEHYADWQDETGVKLIAVSIDEAQKVADVKPYVDSQGWEYDVLLDQNSEFMHALGIQTTPHLLIIDGNGKIVYSHSGYTEGSEGEIIKKLRQITAPAKTKASPRKKK